MCVILYFTLHLVCFCCVHLCLLLSAVTRALLQSRFFNLSHIFLDKICKKKKEEIDKIYVTLPPPVNLRMPQKA